MRAPGAVDISHVRPRIGHYWTHLLCFSLVFLSYYLSLAHAITLERDIVWVVPAGSQDWAVCGASRETACDLPTAAFSIKSLSPGTNATILLSSGTFRLATALVIETAVPISIRMGPGEVSSAIITTGSNDSNVAIMLQAPEATVDGIIFQHFTSPAVLVSENCRVAFTNCGFYSNGGAILSQSANATFVGCIFEDNVVTPIGKRANIAHNGGAVSFQIPISHAFDQRMNITFDSCAFSGNGISSTNSLGRATGGAISILFADSDGLEQPTSTLDLQISRSIFQKNNIHVEAVSGRHLDATAAPQLRGGAIHVAISCTTHFHIYDSIFTNNSVIVHGVKSQFVFGGAVDLSLATWDSTVSLSNTTWSGNFASAGTTLIDEASAGICAGGALNLYTPALVTVQNSTFTNNVCAGSSGGLFAGPVTGGAIAFKVPVETAHEIGPGLSISSSSFVENSVISSFHKRGGLALSAGGAISFSFPSSNTIRSLEVADSRFLGNSAVSPCNQNANVYGGAISLDTTGCAGTVETSLNMGGGALWAIMPGASPSSFNVTHCIFRSNFVGQRNVDEHNSQLLGYGGALSVYSFGQLEISLNGSIFEDNAVQGSGSVNGGAAQIQAVAAIRVVNSTFARNNATCRSPWRSDHRQCRGGAIDTHSDLRTIVSDSSFTSNAVFAESTCSPGAGGAIASASNIVIKNSTFSSNYIRASISMGGAVFANQVDVNQCFFDDNSVSGTIHSSGGSVTLSGTMFTANQTVFQNSRAMNHLSDDDRFATCDEKYFLYRSARRPPAGGGAVALAYSTNLVMQEVKFTNNTATYGGTMMISHPSWDNLPEKRGVSVSSVTIAHSSATVGGSIFVLDACRWGPRLEGLCDLDFRFTNSTASSYGDRCASWPKSLVFNEAPPKFVAPGQLFSTSLVLRDLFNTTVRELTNSGSITAALVTASDPKISLLTGVTLDSVFAGQLGVFSFGGATLLGFANASASIRFTAKSPVLCSRPDAEDLFIEANISTTGCPPAYFDTTSSEHAQSALLCELCPPQTYLFPASGKAKCLPCSEEHHEGHGGEEELYSCLNPPTIVESNDVGHEQHISDWVIQAGYYPSPSLDAPTELLRCPNEACKQFECKAYVDSSYRWHPHRHVIMAARTTLTEMIALSTLTIAIARLDIQIAFVLVAVAILILISATLRLALKKSGTVRFAGNSRPSSTSLLLLSCKSL